MASSKVLVVFLMFQNLQQRSMKIKAGYIKGDRIKHILSKFFFTHELLGIDIHVIQVRSSNNLENLFT